MDVSRLSSGNPAVKQSVPTVINLISDDEDEEEEDDHHHPFEACSDVSVGTHEEVDAASDDGQAEAEKDDDSAAWDVDSLYEDAMQEITDQELDHEGKLNHYILLLLGLNHFLTPDPDVCTLEEAQVFRKQLREVGPEEFFEKTVQSNAITAKKLLTAFGFKPPAFLDGCPDENYYALLSLAVSRELDKRLKLENYNSIEDAVDLLKKSKNIMVITGAGISTSLGIPDFRSQDIGLYATLEELGLEDPQQVFDIELFRHDPTIFYSVAKRILPETTNFSPTHSFIRLLQDKGKLLTNYSQNIDNLEAAAGVQPEKLIQCHGSFAMATCQQCRAKVPGEEIFDDIKNARLPRCKLCAAALQTRKLPMKRKRSSNGMPKKKTKHWDEQDSSSEDESSYDIPEAGIMKPDITFFGEPLSDTFHDRLTKNDRDKVDLVIVIGTSLKVAPVSEITPYLPSNIPQMYISREPVKHVEFDIDLLGDCDVIVAELCRRAGWDLEHEMIPEGQKVEVEVVDGFLSRHVFREVVPPTNGKGNGKEKEKQNGKEEEKKRDKEKYAEVKEELTRVKDHYAKVVERHGELRRKGRYDTVGGGRRSSLAEDED